MLVFWLGFVAGILTAAAIITALGAAIQHGGLKMSASFARPSPTKQAIVDSLLITPPQSLEHVTDALKAASIDAGWAANVPTDEMLEEAELSLGRAYRAVVAWRGK